MSVPEDTVLPRCPFCSKPFPSYEKQEQHILYECEEGE